MSKVKHNNKEKYRIYDQMISSFYAEEQNNKRINSNNNKEIKIEPTLIIESTQKKFKVGFKVGINQMYKIKKITEFYDRMKKHENYKYGLKLEFVHSYGAFEDESQKILDFIMKYAEIVKYTNDNLNHYHTYNSENYILLTESGIDEFFDLLKNKTIDVRMDGKEDKVELLDKEPDIKFEITENNAEEYVITTKSNSFDFNVIYGKDFTYFLQDNRLYRCSKKFENTVLKLLNVFRVNFTKEIPFKKEEFSEIYSLVIPEMKNNISINNVDIEEIEQYIPKKLKAKIFLDIDKHNYIVAEIKFSYDNIEFSPFQDVDLNIPRNIVEESRSLDLFSANGFMFDSVNEKLILANEDKIYDFLKFGIVEMINKFEILATDEFKRREIISPKMSSIGVKIENNLLEIDLSNIDIDSSEIEEIMKKYKLKKRFHRLKNGTFIDLENNESLDTLEKIVESTDINYKELSKGTIKVPISRSLYLDKILKKNNILIKQNEEYQKLIDDINERKIDESVDIPKSLNADLREYQLVGYNWLKNLDDYNLGGILADDMGLGKTLQVLAILLSYKENSKNKQPSLVICPSSLSLNWQSEANRFTPSLRTMVIAGTSEERKNKIKQIGNYDIAITSYDLLKRDIELYEECNYEFRYLVADEAQYIKNNSTQNAKAIKKINAKTRYALTGTPIENSLAELWSIFDFIMPGYLYSYTKFKAQYETPIIKDENESVTKRLKEMISPFILRRVKEKVLTELPDKTISVLNNEMDGEQLSIYLSYVKSARKQAKEELEANGVQNSQIKILALLMRLRQICCHPGLFIENYNEGSRKLAQCVEIIKDAVDSGHKILLFSGYASMFPYIKEELEKVGINYFTLTGQTKVSDRMDLVNDFNSNDNVKVFLISLKAGGTGLNLIGADVVIHYDPWWNISIENQATDRAYRIGQKRNVQVYKLITKNSIEEKIYNLQEKKAKLVNDILSTNQTFISKLSEDEIMKLFE